MNEVFCDSMIVIKLFRLLPVIHVSIFLSKDQPKIAEMSNSLALLWTIHCIRLFVNFFAQHRFPE